KAAKIWKRAVELGDVDAMVFLGELYQYGEGVKLDKKKAERLFRMAVDRGDAVAQNKIGCSLHSEKKFEEAFRYYALSADQGFTEGENNLACCYRYGEGTESSKKAAKLYLRAAELGEVYAMVALGALYETGGNGVKRDGKKAMKMYREVADRGLALAQSNLSNLLSVDGQYMESFRYCKLAADQGYTQAQYNAGYCYENAEGVERNLGEAKRLYALSAAKGYGPGIAALGRIGA
ncbi:hypothetical protein AURANDRAFT_21291, partial [Aureococcus anophagefferens]